MAPAPFRLPVRVVVLDLVGALCAGLGFYGLIEDAAATSIPLLAVPGVAPALLLLGLALMGYAIGALLARIRRAARARDEAPVTSRSDRPRM